MSYNRARRRRMSWNRKGKPVGSKVPLGSPLQRVHSQPQNSQPFPAAKGGTERPEDELVVSARWTGGKTGKELMPVDGKYDSEPTIWHNFESDEAAEKQASRLRQRGFIDVKIGKRKDIVKPKSTAPVSRGSMYHGGSYLNESERGRE